MFSCRTRHVKIPNHRCAIVSHAKWEVPSLVELDLDGTTNEVAAHPTATALVRGALGLGGELLAGALETSLALDLVLDSDLEVVNDRVLAKVPREAGVVADGGGIDGRTGDVVRPGVVAVGYAAVGDVGDIDWRMLAVESKRDQEREDLQKTLSRLSLPGRPEGVP